MLFDNKLLSDSKSIRAKLFLVISLLKCTLITLSLKQYKEQFFILILTRDLFVMRQSFTVYMYFILEHSSITESLLNSLS